MDHLSRCILSLMACLHRGPIFFMVMMDMMQITKAAIPKMVNNQPFPMAWISGEATTEPTQERILRTKVFRATPADDFLGMNSVSMVVAMPKMSMEPTPKKKLANI